MRTCIGRSTYCLRLNSTMKSDIAVSCLLTDRNGTASFCYPNGYSSHRVRRAVSIAGTRMPVSSGAAWRIRSLTLTLSPACK